MTITVTSGHTSSGLTISAGDPLVVLSGGTAEDITISSGGSATLSSGALGNDLVVSSGGVLLGPGDLEGFTTVHSGSISGVTLVSQSDLIFSGGTGSDITAIQSSGIDVEEGGSVSGTVVSDGALLAVFAFDGGSAFAGSSIIGSGGKEEILSGGVASGDVVQSGGLLSVETGGSVSDETVRSGGTLDFDGDITTNVSAGVQASTTLFGGTTVASGGIVDLGAVTVRSGATLSLGAAASAGVDAVEAGGVIAGSGVIYTVDNNTAAVAGELSGVTIEGAAAPIELKSGGRAINVSLGAVVDDFNQLGELYVESGATTTGAAVIGTEVIESGGAAIGTAVSAGVIDVLGTTTGTLVFASSFVKSGGVASGTITEIHGLETVYYGGVASAAVVSSGGREVVRTGGVASGTNVLSGGIEYLWAGTTTGTEVSAGGKEVISSGGVADAATVLSGGAEYVFSGGVGSGASVSGGGEAIVRSGGLAEATTLLSRGAEFIYSGGADEGAVVSAGAKQVISSGGVATGLSLLSGGTVIDEGSVRIAGDGTLAGILSGSGAVIETGGGDLVLSSYADRDFAGKAVISGGVVELATLGALGTGYAQFVAPAAGSAVLQIDAADAPAAGKTFANTLDNFDDDSEALDLRGLAFVAGASATLAGDVLVLHDGGATYSFTLAGNTATTYAVASDGHGGTLIDPKVTAFAQSAAAFAPATAAKTALVCSTATVTEMPFLHATASAGASHH